MSGDGADHLSIGEVLAQLQAEFPDVTISKIRFLESQGLIDPERTPSGYRKFYPADVARLRWILVEQRDHFLPLKVIKDRLEAHDPTTGDLPPQTPGPAPSPPPAAPTPPRRPMPPSSLPSKPTPTPAERAAAAAPPRPAVIRRNKDQDTGQSTGQSTDQNTAQDKDHDTNPRTNQDTNQRQDQETRTVSTPSSAPAASEPPVRRRTRELTLPLVLDGEPAVDDDDEPDTFDRVALARATGVTEAALDELESYGVIKPFHDDGIRAFFDRDALVCVQAAAALGKHGLQPRHLKMYVHFTEREGALFQQVLAPFLRQRNPVSRAKVDDTLAELVSEARALRGALLRRAIEDALGD